MKKQNLLRVSIAVVLAFFVLFGVSKAFEAVIVSANRAYVSVFSQRLILDAGHGGFDGGTTGVNGVLEKDINLAITQKTASLARLAGFSVITVRDTDTGVNDDSAKTIREKKVSDIHKRLALTDEYPDALYLSIHQNHYPDSSCHGAQVFYSPNDSMSKTIAVCMRENIKRLLDPSNNREIKRAEKNLYILSKAQVPAVLLECGFLSNSEECTLLCDTEYQQKLALCAVASLMESINRR